MSRVAAGLSAAPRFVGKLADLLPLQNTVATAVQSVVVLGVAAEHGVKNPAERIVAARPRAAAAATSPPSRSSRCSQRAKGTYSDEALGAPDARFGRGGNLRTLWRVARLLSRIDDALDARPKGKLHHRALANLPVVGVVGGYAAEREGLRRARGGGGRDPGRPPGQEVAGSWARLAYTSRVAVDRFMVMKWMPGTPSSSSVRQSSVATSTP